MISNVTPLQHPSLPGIMVFILDGEALRGSQQRVLVVMQPKSRIPMHSHSVDASMFVVAGSAKLLSDNEFTGYEVRVGHRVDFARFRNHGFEAGPQGMSFLSSNGGIVDGAGNWDVKMKGGD